MTDHRFRRLLLAIVLLAAVLRVAYVVAVTRHDDGLYDATYYELQARSITAGDGFFLDPFALLADATNVREAADHPPLTVLVLLPAALVGDPDASALAMRLTMVAFGCATVAVCGGLGRRLATPTVGLGAAAAAAVDPNLWTNDGLIMSEAPATLLVAGALAVAVARRDRPDDGRLLLALGGLAGLAALARTELALLAPALLLPSLLAGPWRDRGRAVALTGAAGLAVVGPWVAFNLARFEEPVAISTNVGLALRAANCDLAYEGSGLGSLQVFAPCVPADDGTEQSVRDRRLRDDALAYVADHATRAPVVAAARVGRTWSAYALDDTAATAEREGRPRWTTWLAVGWTWLTAPLVVVGAVARRRGGRPVALLLAPALVITVAVAIASGGLLRYRSPAEPGLLVLAAVGVAALGKRRARPAHR